MIEGELKEGDRVVHKRTQGTYTIVSPDAQVKVDPVIDWTPCVVYRQDYSGAIFVRNVGTFRENFVRWQ